MPEHHQPQREDPAPWEWLYAVVGAGMWGFTQSRFRAEVVGVPLPRVAAGQVWIATHRAETDVPLLAGLLFVHAGMWRGAASRLYFAARDDLFRPGVVAAGVSLPGPVARLAWPLSPGPWLPRVRAYPIRRPTGLKLEQVVADLPADTSLESVIGPRLISLVHRSGNARGRSAPRTVADIRDARHARVLWEDVREDDLVGALGGEIWRRHVARAAGDVRRLVGMVRDGRPMLLFPEGRVSPDGAIGPIGDLLDLVVRRGHPRAVVPLGIAYDPLTRHRTEAVVGAGTPISPGHEPILAAAGSALRRAVPVTAGQLLARYVTRASAAGVASTASAQRLAEEVVGAAIAQGRPVARRLRSPMHRPDAVRDGLAALARRGCLALDADGGIRLDAGRIHADAVVQRLATEDRDLWRP
jgi:1-acyl-sn-glycerol-3-phosphate acyltransferase